MTAAFAARYDVTTPRHLLDAGGERALQVREHDGGNAGIEICITVTSMTEMVIAQRWPGESGSSVTGRGS